MFFHVHRIPIMTTWTKGNVARQPDSDHFLSNLFDRAVPVRSIHDRLFLGLGCDPDIDMDEGTSGAEVFDVNREVVVETDRDLGKADEIYRVLWIPDERSGILMQGRLKRYRKYVFV